MNISAFSFGSGYFIFMKSLLLKFVWGLFLLVAGATAPAQSIINYQITPFGGANSLVTWNVSGSLVDSLGVQWVVTASNGSFGGVPIVTSGLFAPGYAGTAFPGNISSPDGSYFHNVELGQNFAINMYFAGIFGSTNIFGLVTPPATTTDGQHLIYSAATQSVVIPIAYSNFNPGSYQSVFGAGEFFNSPVTVNLTVGVVPEPSTLALSVVVILAGFLNFRLRE